MKLFKILCLGLLIHLTSPMFSQCNSSVIFANESSNAVCTEVVDNVRSFYSNNYPDHSIGNVTSINNLTTAAQDDTWMMCAYPMESNSFTNLYSSEAEMGCTTNYVFGIGLNGVKYDPNSAVNFEYTDGGGETQTNYDWHYSAYNNFNVVQNNENHAHLNPFGEYHYHGVPTDYFMNSNYYGMDGTSHSPIVGYAADGFPIYYKYVFANVNGTGGITSLGSGYSLKSGSREVADDIPQGTYNGDYVEDYQYSDASTDLDECNGRYAVTPDFPSGTYYYVITDNFPYIPRCFKGTELDHSFRVGPSVACPDSTADTDCSASLSTRTYQEFQEDLKVLVHTDYLEVSINSASDDATMFLRIYDLNGRVIGVSENSRVEINNNFTGVCFLEVNYEEHQIIKKILIQ